MLFLEAPTSFESSKAVILESSPTAALFRLRGRLITELDKKTIGELIGNESKTVIFWSLNDLAPQYLCKFFTKTWHAPPSTSGTSRLFKSAKTFGNQENALLSGELKYRIAFLLCPRQHSPLTVLRPQ